MAHGPRSSSVEGVGETLYRVKCLNEFQCDDRPKLRSKKNRGDFFVILLASFFLDFSYVIRYNNVSLR